jgi:hypothetical protein
MILFFMTVSFVAIYNYDRDVKHLSIPEIIFGERSAEMTMIKIALGIIYIIVSGVVLVVGTQQVIADKATFATNWWWALLDLIIIGVCGLFGCWAGTAKIDIRYWIISVVSIIFQLGFTIDFISFLFL